jgi:Phosphotransferase enzyme family
VRTEQLAPLARAAFGQGRRIATVTRLAGASKKGVYRAVFDDGFAAVIYSWAPAEDYWPDAGREVSQAGPFSHASGLDLFLAAHTRLTELGIRTPALYLADASREHYPADVAVLEYVPGPSLEQRMESNEPAVPAVLQQLGEALRTLHADSCNRAGKLLQVAAGGGARPADCARLVLDGALGHLAEAAARVPEIAAVQPQLADTLRQQAAGIAPRDRCSLIHGELGPDHVLIDAQGKPVIVDIEGLMYFDPEWEHVFLQLRFDEGYRYLQAAGLDQQRIDLYWLAMNLSLVAGPLRILDGDYPDREPMLQIAAHATGRVLAAARASR